MSEKDRDAARWKALDAASYDDVADDFDVHSHRLALPVAEHLVELAALRDGERALDVGTGTGMVPFEIDRRALPRCSVVGVDISSGMMEAARARAAAAGLSPARVDFLRMDAESLDFDDAEFDVVLSAFALGHIPAPDKAVREMYRVLRPGGRLLIAVGSRPPLLSTDTVTHAWAEIGRRVEIARHRRVGSTLLDTLVARLAPPVPDEPHGSHMATTLNRAAPVASLMSAAGFTAVRRSWRNYQNEIETAEDFWAMQRTICTTARKRLLNAPPAVVEQVHDEFVAICDATLERGGTLVFPISAVFVEGRKSSV
jgi:ubiquinone/menaquinone biosynthesis C-methylase UbiE